MPDVVFLPSGRRGTFPFKTDLLTAARALGVYVRTSCLGEGRCAECLVQIEEGMRNLSPILEDEVGAITRRGVRLACRAKMKGDVVVRTLEDAPPPDQTPADTSG
jgi:uncharacterized 2Fe-2S/4Fe-4S cluster protein (DUF4445 family)